MKRLSQVNSIRLRVVEMWESGLWISTFPHAFVFQTTDAV